MTIPAILEQLDRYTGQYPMEAVQAAVAEREAITPELLRILESAAADPATWAQQNETSMLLVLAFFLLAQFREKRAYPLVVQLVSAPGEIPFDLIGDTVTEGLDRVLASLYDGNPGPLHGLVENESANEFARSAALETLLVLEHTNQMPRATLVEYLRSLFGGRLQRTHSYAWDALVCTAADLPAPELLEEVRQAYAEGLVDPAVADLAGIERDLAAPKQRRERLYLVDDAIAETEWWACFHPEDSQPSHPPVQPPAPTPAPNRESGYVPPRPFIREPKIDRNEPCPCGSGKKYKKCFGTS